MARRVCRSLGSHLLVATALAVAGCHAGGARAPDAGGPAMGGGGSGDGVGGGGTGGSASGADMAMLPPSTAASWWLTTAGGDHTLEAQTDLPFSDAASADLTITIDASRQYQTMTGFGASLTDSAAWVLAKKMNDAQRAAAMSALFSVEQGIGVSLLRQPIGTSDLAWSYYSFDDVPAGQSDPMLTSFSIARDQPYIIPMVQQALATNPQLRVMASPWSAPAWMKTNGSLTNTGSLIDPTSYPAYAQYLVKFIQAYQTAGIPIWAITTINEPLIQPVGYPSMSMQWNEQANLVRYHLGPALAAAGLTTKILLFDHNWDHASFPKQILDDSAEVRAYAGGVAFHCYGGDPSAMDMIHDAYPDMDIFVTECSGGGWSGSFGDSLKTQFQDLYIGSTRHWAKSVVRWNLALDDRHGPYPGSGGTGCTTCIGLITVHDDGTFSREVDYWAMAHASRFVRPGARRVESNTFGDGSIEDVAFVNADGSTALLVLNSSAGARSRPAQWPTG